MSAAADAPGRPAAGAALLLGGAAAALAWALAPALAPWPLSGHSAALDLQRAEAWHSAVAAGDLFPRWLPDLYGGYGSPIFNYYAPLPYALGELFRASGAGALWAPKLALAALFVSGALGARALARRLFGPLAGAVAFGLWALQPYLLLDLYVRSALGEIAGLALLPWALVGLLAVGSPPRAAAVARAAFAFALLVVAHNIVALLAAPALALVALAAKPAAARLARSVALALGLALSAFYWLPALAEKDLVWAEESLTLGQFDVERNFLPTAVLLPWRAQLEIPAHRALPFELHLGYAFWLAVAAAPWVVRRTAPAGRPATLAWTAAAVLVLVAATALAAPLWRLLPLARFVQFPFRLLGPVSLAGVMLAAAAVATARARWRALAALAALGLGLLAARPVVAQARYGFVERATLETRPLTRAEAVAAQSDPALLDPVALARESFAGRPPYSGTSRDDYLPRTVLRRPAPVAGAEAVIPPPAGAGVRVLSDRRRGTRLSAEVAVEAPAQLLFHQFHFPGWRATVDGAPRAPSAEPVFGRLQLELRPGERAVELRFGDTPVRRAGRLAAGAAALALALALGRERWRARRGGEPLLPSPPRGPAPV